MVSVICSIALLKGAHAMSILEKLRAANTQCCNLGFGHTLSSWSVLEWAGAMAGECGEACNIAKKMLRFRDNVKGNDPKLSRDDYKCMLASEVAGMIIYADLLCASEGINLCEAIEIEFNKKSREVNSGIYI
jgi:hypothetical protein